MRDACGQDLQQQLGHLAGGRPEAREHEREQHEEQRTDRDQEHHGEDPAPLREQVAVAVERPGEVEPEHAAPPVGAEGLGGDQRREERERRPDDEHVVAVRDQVLDGDVPEDHRERDRGERGQVRDRERDRRQHLVPAAAAEPEHAPRRELDQGQDRARRTLAGAVVAPGSRGRTGARPAVTPRSPR